MAEKERGTSSADSPGRQLTDLQVHFISLVESAANGRTFLAKEAKASGLDVIRKDVPILKTDDVRHMVYGIVYAPDETDSQGDTMKAEDIEKAAYDFMRKRRTTAVDTDHNFEEGSGFVAESWLVKEDDCLFPEEIEGAWAVGIKVTDIETWKRVEKGELKGLSLAGLARVVDLEKAALNDEIPACAGTGSGRRTTGAPG